MRLDKLLTRNRIIDLKSRDQKSVLVEMATLACEADRKLKHDQLLKALLARENTLTTAMFILVVGRSAQGVVYDQFQDQPVHLFLMLIGAPKEKGFLRVLNALAEFGKDVDTVKRILHEAPTSTANCAPVL